MDMSLFQGTSKMAIDARIPTNIFYLNLHLVNC